jgi:hypothetical protein
MPQVTDVVRGRLQVTPAGIDTIAEAAKSGHCSLRVIAIEERLPRKQKVQRHRHDSDDDEDEDDGSSDYSDESDDDSYDSWTSASEDEGPGAAGVDQQGGQQQQGNQQAPSSGDGGVGGSGGGGGGNSSSSSSSSSDSEWEEVKPEQEVLSEDVSAAIQQRVQVAQASRILVGARCAEWQKSGLLMRRYSDFREDFGKHRFRRDRMA